MADLKDYRRKRHPGRTPEPFGEDGIRRPVAPGAPRLFVVQQHAARSLHWDLRLEIDGALASWAVPKGPSLDPREKRLAIRTEDHPLEYAGFEGVIPDGNYGAGAMIVWDRGAYRIVDGRSPAQGLDDGKLDLLLEGVKLRGRFALVRTTSSGPRHWLLIRKGAPLEGQDVVDLMPASVLSGSTVEQLREGGRENEIERDVAAAGAPLRDAAAGDLRPMLARTAEAAFSRDGWIFEVKHDGMRVLAARDDEAATLRSRTGRDVTALFPELELAVRRLPLSECVLDGEIVTHDQAGRSSFARLQRRLACGDAAAVERAVVEVPVLLEAFDLLRAAGRDLRQLPLVERKRLLAEIVPAAGLVRYCDHVERDGLALYEAARAHGLEGVMAKKASSRYLSGRRADTWRKVRAEKRGSFAVVGWREGEGARRELGALVLAWRDGDGWRHAGNVGSGLGERTVSDLLPRLRRLNRRTPPCAIEPAKARGVSFVRPELRCEVRYLGLTPALLLRQPVFLGLREDVEDADVDEAPVDRESAVAAAPAPARAPQRLTLSNLGKVFWPDEGYTKGDLIAYHEAAWPWMAPYLRDRPVVLVRYPDGIDGKSFFQHDAPPHAPDWAQRVRIGDTDYFLCNDRRTLLHVINSGAIPLHAWSARASSLERPDWLVLDLDPKDAPFEHVTRIARHLHRLLGSLEQPHFVKTSGQSGLHVMLPLGGALGHDEARSLAEVLARWVVAELPEIATVVRPVAARRGRVYVDFMQNGRGKTIVAPLSVRPRPGAPVSMPLTWPQVSARLDPARWSIRTALARLGSRGNPLRGLLEEAIDPRLVLEAVASRLGASRGDP